MTEKVKHFIELVKKQEIIEGEYLIDWPFNFAKYPIPNILDNTIRLVILI